ncbi:Uncharacterized protein SCF082_LOCUS31516 [Durusdinium trenchii]|uniref:Uncharacterized protein n=1 Tax=Durusdinium trenchii TaxID=1381693 RepID=A0ABP0NAX1_9DINO
MSTVASRRLAKLGVVDPDLEPLARYGRSKTGKSGNNASRDFHRFIHRSAKVFAVQISTTNLLIKVKKPNKSGRRIKKEETVDFPIILLSSWMQSILPTCPQFFLGGLALEDRSLYHDMLQSYWEGFLSNYPDHLIKNKPVAFKRNCIPIAVHGDEGRTLGKTPLLVISYQVVIPHNGPNELNIKKTSGLHPNYFFIVLHLLEGYFYDLVPMDASISGLCKALADDMTKLYETGVTVDVS